MTRFEKKIRHLLLICIEKFKVTIRNILFIPKRIRLKNKNMSVFSSNCLGCCVLHDLNVRFNSPFVNLYLNAKDYLKFLENPAKYNHCEFTSIPSNHKYPVMQLEDITIHFVHYTSVQEAQNAWKRRIERIDFNNLFVIFSERDGCTYEDLKKFDSLPYENKIVFTYKPYNDIDSCVYIKGFENQGCLGDMIDWCSFLSPKKIYDSFDFVSWFNGTYSSHSTKY